MSELKVITSDNNISEAWGEAFFSLYSKRGAKEFSPLVVSVTGFSDSLDVPENSSIRSALDDYLGIKSKPKVETISNTIFPWRLWIPNRPRNELYQRHTKILPSIESCAANVHGHYFRRMIDFNGDGQINQLEKMFNIAQGNHRHSGMQIGIFDPDRDHRPNPYMGFPCLHQISIDLYGSNGDEGMGITAFYATQLLDLKAYGNYLGLCRLGKFIAKELGLRFHRLNCISGEAKFDSGYRKTSQATIDLINVITQNLN